MDKKTGYLILGLMGVVIVAVLAFDLYVLKIGRFWEKGKSQEVKQEITSVPIQKPPNQVDAQVKTKKEFLNLLP